MPYTREQKTEFYEKSAEELKHLIGFEGKYALDNFGKMARLNSLSPQLKALPLKSTIFASLIYICL